MPCCALHVNIFSHFYHIKSGSKLHYSKFSAFLPLWLLYISIKLRPMRWSTQSVWSWNGICPADLVFVPSYTWYPFVKASSIERRGKLFSSLPFWIKKSFVHTYWISGIPHHWYYCCLVCCKPALRSFTFGKWKCIFNPFLYQKSISCLLKILSIILFFCWVW